VKKCALFLLFPWILVCADTPPPPKENVAGIANYGAVTLDSLQGAGLVKLNGTSVLNTAHFDGSFLANDVRIGALEVSGEANLTAAIIGQKSFIFGSLQAVRSTFSKPLTLLTQKAVFTGCKIESIIVKKDTACKGKQVLELKLGTIVDGSIEFESGKGEVVLFPGSQVLGPITGGKVLKKF